MGRYPGRAEALSKAAKRCSMTWKNAVRTSQMRVADLQAEHASLWRLTPEEVLQAKPLHAKLRTKLEANEGGQRAQRDVILAQRPKSFASTPNDAELAHQRCGQGRLNALIQPVPPRRQPNGGRRGDPGLTDTGKAR